MPDAVVASHLVSVVAGCGGGKVTWINNDPTWTKRSLEDDNIFSIAGIAMDKVVMSQGTYFNSWNYAPSGFFASAIVAFKSGP